ncbi:hypothetical protein BB561_005062 [Smittium simulii]|uniref:Uncharacterized protein n=1 Tax=Smittium simulii TaxID=133385 RepID=A0A2T9YCF6_9FUNG|nr:hypothetical protein BB561_005062 [Smittium simulii]
MTLSIPFGSFFVFDAGRGCTSAFASAGSLTSSQKAGAGAFTGAGDGAFNAAGADTFIITGAFAGAFAGSLTSSQKTGAGAFTGAGAGAFTSPHSGNFPLLTTAQGLEATKLSPKMQRVVYSSFIIILYRFIFKN